MCIILTSLKLADPEHLIITLWPELFELNSLLVWVNAILLKLVGFIHTHIHTVYAIHFSRCTEWEDFSDWARTTILHGR